MMPTMKCCLTDSRKKNEREKGGAWAIKREGAWVITHNTSMIFTLSSCEHGIGWLSSPLPLSLSFSHSQTLSQQTRL